MTREKVMDHERVVRDYLHKRGGALPTAMMMNLLIHSCNNDRIPIVLIMSHIEFGRLTQGHQYEILSGKS